MNKPHLVKNSGQWFCWFEGRYTRSWDGPSAALEKMKNMVLGPKLPSLRRQQEIEADRRARR